MGFPVDLVVDMHRRAHCLISGEVISEAADSDLFSGLAPAAEVHELGQATACLAGLAEASSPATLVRGVYSRDLSC